MAAGGHKNVSTIPVKLPGEMFITPTTKYAKFDKNLATEQVTLAKLVLIVHEITV